MRSAGYTDFALYRRLLSQARPYWPHIAGVFLLSLLSTPLSLLTPLPMKIAVDGIVGSHPVPGFLQAVLPAFATGSEAAIIALAVALVMIIALLSLIRELGHSLLRTYAGENLVLSFRARLFRHLQRLSLSFYSSKETSDLVYRIQWDAPSIQHVAIDGVIPLVTSGLTLVSMIYIIFQLDWQLALVALATAPVLFALSWIYRWQLRRRSREVKKLESAALSVTQEVLSDVRVVKAFGQEEREQARFVRRSSEGMHARISLAFQEGTYSLLTGLTTAAGTAAVLFLGLKHVQSGAITLGEMLLIIGYLSQFYSPLKTISSNMTRMQSYLAGAERAFSILDEAPDVVERPMARRIARASGTIAFRDVSFAYENRPPVLRDISFEIDPGTHVGILGMSGAGKTTLVSLLTRFYDPTTGQILLDGVDLRDYKLADMRRQFAIVLQEPVLFSTSIAENIAYARPRARYRDIVAAAKAAGAHEFIVRLPEGYNTLVGERGVRLSGGERQRIALARAFLRNAPILILDEPTSSVDVETEAMITEALDSLARGRTSFMIAHRLSTLDRCDVRFRIEDGCLLDVTSATLTIAGEANEETEPKTNIEWGTASG